MMTEGWGVYKYESYNAHCLPVPLYRAQAVLTDFTKTVSSMTEDYVQNT